VDRDRPSDFFGSPFPAPPVASSSAAGLRCMYLNVVARSLCPASSWMARAGTPRIARCEQNVWRNLWTPHSTACSTCRSRDDALDDLLRQGFSRTMPLLQLELADGNARTRLRRPRFRSDRVPNTCAGLCEARTATRTRSKPHRFTWGCWQASKARNRLTGRSRAPSSACPSSLDSLAGECLL
jgi:hypothetical protein